MQEESRVYRRRPFIEYTGTLQKVHRGMGIVVHWVMPL